MAGGGGSQETKLRDEGGRSGIVRIKRLEQCGLFDNEGRRKHVEGAIRD